MEGVTNLKIHIVQKGDTLWNLAQKYGVDFEELKQMNAQLANPDMIMPGMKVKIPSTTKQVQKQPTMDKTMQPYKDMSPKAMPMVQEDDHKPAPKIKKTMPKPTPPKQPPMNPMPMPNLPDFYSNNYNIDVDIEDNDLEVNQHSIHQMNQQPHVPVQQPMMPVCYMMPPCMPMPQAPPMMQPMHWNQMNCEKPVDYCEQYANPHQSMNHHSMMPSYYQEEEMESSQTDMPPMPKHPMPMQSMQQPQQPMYEGEWQQPMHQMPMWSPSHQEQMPQMPHMEGQGQYMQPNMMQMSPQQNTPPVQPGMPMPYQGNMNPYQPQGAYPFRQNDEEYE